MENAFDKIFEQSYKWEVENGISNNPNDMGGATNDGITWETYLARCQIILNRRPTKANFLKLTKKEVKAFYFYIWKIVKCDQIENTAVAGACFDFALNSEFGKREIQEVLRDDYGYTQVKADNIFGPVTIGAINYAVKQFGAKRVTGDIFDKREAYLRDLVKRKPSQQGFADGWTNRIESWRDFTNKIITQTA